MRITLACRRGANGEITTRRIWWRSYLEKDVRANNEDLIVRRHIWLLSAFAYAALLDDCKQHCHESSSHTGNNNEKQNILVTDF